MNTLLIGGQPDGVHFDRHYQFINNSVWIEAVLDGFIIIASDVPNGHDDSFEYSYFL